MKHSSKTLSILWVALIWWVVAITTASTFAFWGQWENWERWIDHEEISIAVEANDYSLLSAEAQEKIDAEKFAEIVEKTVQKTVRKAQMEAAVAAGDYETFSSLKETFKAEKETMKEAKIAERLATATDEEKVEIEARIARKSERKSQKEEKTEEEKIEKFNELVTYYNENGELPVRAKKGKGHKKNGAKRGGWKMTDGSSRGSRGNRNIQEA